MTTIRMLCSIAAFMVGLGAMAAVGQNYPERTLRLVVPFPPGSATTAAVRVIAGEIEKIIAKPIVIENKAGALGQIGTEDIARAQPDGYTIGWCNDGPVATVPAGLRVAGKVPPYDYRSFKPIGRAGYVTFVLVVRKDLPITSLAELIAYAKANPGKLSAASGSPTSTMSVRLLNKLQGTDIVDIRYWQRSEPEALKDMLVGDIHLMVSTYYNARPFLESGDVRAIGVLGDERSPLAPNLKTLVEQGIPEFGGAMGETWGGLCGPNNLPQIVADTLNDALKRTLSRKGVTERLATTGWFPSYSTADEFGAQFKKQDASIELMIRDTDTQLY